jgi:hypothetical protein
MDEKMDENCQEREICSSGKYEKPRKSQSKAKQRQEIFKCFETDNAMN